MATTYQAAPVNSWQQVSEALENVLISHDNVQPVHVYIGTTAPDGDSAYHRCTAARPFSLGGVTGQDVYIRAGSTSPLIVTVTAV
jgi:hypothetical protein